MATEKTKTVSGRVPVAVATALENDAENLGTTPGALIRQMLEGRYSVRRGVGKSDHKSVKQTPQLVAISEDEE